MVDFSQQVHNARENSNCLFTCRSLTLPNSRHFQILTTLWIQSDRRKLDGLLLHINFLPYYFEDQESCFIFPLCFSCKYNLFEKKKSNKPGESALLISWIITHYTKVDNIFWNPIIIFHQSPLFTAKSRAPAHYHTSHMKIAYLPYFCQIRG